MCPGNLNQSVLFLNFLTEKRLLVILLNQQWGGTLKLFLSVLGVLLILLKIFCFGSRYKEFSVYERTHQAVMCFSTSSYNVRITLSTLSDCKSSSQQRESSECVNCLFSGSANVELSIIKPDCVPELAPPETQVSYPESVWLKTKTNANMQETLTLFSFQAWNQTDHCLLPVMTLTPFPAVLQPSWSSW